MNYFIVEGPSRFSFEARRGEGGFSLHNICLSLSTFFPFGLGWLEVRDVALQVPASTSSFVVGWVELEFGFGVGWNWKWKVFNSP
jgi:hypothetical protein